MTTPRRKYDDNSTAVINPEGIFRDGRRIAGASSRTQAIGNLTISPRSLEATIYEVATPPSMTQHEDTSHAKTARHVSEERPASRAQPIHSASTAISENTLHEQIAVISALIKDAVVRLLRDVGRPTELHSDAKVVNVIKSVVNRAVPSGF